MVKKIVNKKKNVKKILTYKDTLTLNYIIEKTGFSTKREVLKFAKDNNIIKERMYKNDTDNQKRAKQKRFLKAINKARIANKAFKKNKQVIIPKAGTPNVLDKIIEGLQGYVETDEKVGPLKKKEKVEEKKVEVIDHEKNLSLIRDDRIFPVDLEKNAFFKQVSFKSNSEFDNIYDVYKNNKAKAFNESYQYIFKKAYDIIKPGYDIIGFKLLVAYQVASFIDTTSVIDEYDERRPSLISYNKAIKKGLKPPTLTEIEEYEEYTTARMTINIFNNKFKEPMDNETIRLINIDTPHDKTIENNSSQLQYTTISLNITPEDFINMNKEKLEKNINLQLKANLLSIKYIFGVIGFTILPVMNPEKNIFKNYITNLKAFSPNIDYNYHKETLCSTTKDRICIYQTYYYLEVDNTIIINKNKDKIKEALMKENKNIIKFVKDGELVNFLTSKSIETKKRFYVEFYKPVSEIVGFKVELDKIIPITQLSDFYGKKVFLYHKQHVAPRKNNYVEFTNNKKIDKRSVVKNFSLRCNKIKGRDEDSVKKVLGFDFETYVGKDSECIPYALCMSDGKAFYGENIVKEFCNYLDTIKTEDNFSKTHSKNKIPKIFIYGFNNSRFDNIFIFDEIITRLPSAKYCIMDSSIKYIKYHNICIYDLSLYYVGSLDSVSRAFKLNINKGVFPYKFVNKDNLNYIGEVPESKYWNSEEDRKEYIEKEGNIFDNKKYSIKYCVLDSLLVEKIANLHLSECKGEINGVKYDIRSCPTAAGGSLKLYQQVFLKNTLFSSPTVVQVKERNAYYGGRTEVFKKNFSSVNNKKLYYYDINSSYPYAMTFNMPSEFINNIKVTETVSKTFVDTNLYYAKSTYMGNDPNFIPNLLIRSDKGDIIAIKDTPYGYYWGCELNEAVANNCEITISEIIQYKSEPVFKDFAEHFYNSRLGFKKTNAVKAEFCKLVMNSLYGKFGQSIKNENAICSTQEEVALILHNVNNKFVDYEPFNDKVLIKYINIQKSDKSIGNLVRFSSYIAAKAKCNLSLFMRNVGHDNVYYCDTDSVFTTKKPSDDLVCQTTLGKWKLETVDIKDDQGNVNKVLAEINNADFLAPKSYRYKVDNYVAMKAKGQPSRLVESKNFDEVIKNGSSSIDNDTMFFRRLDGVKIKPQNRTMKTVYNKRIFNDDNESKAYDNYQSWYDNKYPKKI